LIAGHGEGMVWSLNWLDGYRDAQRGRFCHEWVRPPSAVGDLANGEVVMELGVITGSQILPGGLRAEATSTLQMRRSALDQYLIELVDQNSWITGLRRMITTPGLHGRP
jgi:hypothetical protein